MKIKTLAMPVIMTAALLLASCSQSSQATEEVVESAPPTETPTKEPTSAPTEIPTEVPTNIPEPTLIPGSLVYPIDTLDNSIPWLPLDESKRPTASYYGFNVHQPPFNNVLVRQAFASAINRQTIADMAAEFYFENVRPATTLTPPETLGRDLYNQVGMVYDPARAKELLVEAGYADIGTFPPVVLLVSTRGEAAPGTYSRIADEIVKQWRDELGVSVEVRVIGDFGRYHETLEAGEFGIYQLTWGADVNDPDNFLNVLFHSTSEYNYGDFASVQFDSLVNRATGKSDPAERQILYIQAERILTEDLVGIIPLWHSYFYLGR